MNVNRFELMRLIMRAARVSESTLRSDMRALLPALTEEERARLMAALSAEELPPGVLAPGWRVPMRV